MKNTERISPYLYDYIKKKVNLFDFLENEIGCNMKWYEVNVSAGTVCPLPQHKDTKPSFRIKFMEDSGTWIYHCLGCNSKGTIIDFCMEYYNLRSSSDAVIFICNKFGFKKNDVSIVDSLRDVRKKINFQKKIDCSHVVASRQCFSLLKKDYNKYSKWVANAYETMNEALDNNNLDSIESIGFEASNKIIE